MMQIQSPKKQRCQHGRLWLAVLLAGTMVGIALHVGKNNPAVTITLTPATYSYARGWMQPLQLSQRTESMSAETLIATPETPLPPNHAAGMLLFMNNGGVPVTFQSSTLVGKSGVAVSFYGPITIPPDPGAIYVPGFALPAGAGGNLPAFDILQPCCGSQSSICDVQHQHCGPDIMVKSFAFSLDHSLLAQQQTAIEDAARGDSSWETQNILLSMHFDEAQHNQGVALDSTRCQSYPARNYTLFAGQKVEVMVVAVTCREQIYSLVPRIAVMGPPNADYLLFGQMIVRVPGTGTHAFDMTATTQSVWMYHFSPAHLQMFSSLIEGKSQQEAMQSLLNQVGVASVVIRSGDRLPDPAHMHVVIQFPSLPLSPGEQGKAVCEEYS